MTSPTSRHVRATAFLAALAFAGCGGKARLQARAAGAPGAVHAPGVGFVTPARLLPDLVNDKGSVRYEAGAWQVLVNRMRVVAHDDGTLERAREVFPPGDPRVTALPSRLGGGFLFYEQVGGGALLWRSKTWLGTLEPLVRWNHPIAGDRPSFVPGFDRLYVVPTPNAPLRAVDVATGEELPVRPLPPASSYGDLAFADGWRAVVEADIRGVLATFDAGATWRPIPVNGKVTAITLSRNVDGDPIVHVDSGGRYVIDARGNVTYRSEAGKQPAATDLEEKTARPPGPLGRRPLRAAVEDGWPDSPDTAVVARGGALARVSLRDGAVLDIAEDAFAERQAGCHAIRLGYGIGFVCGERDGATVVYELEPPLAMRPVMRFARPRFVSPSSRGALVVRGGCTDEPAISGETRPYCIRSVTGVAREIRVKGDLGVERVVALADGRVAVLAPPRPGAGGELTILNGSSGKTVPLRLPAEPRATAAQLRRGMWLDGFEERDPGVLAGWVEGDQQIVGVRVALDGTVTAGELRKDPGGEDGGTLVSGRFALSLAGDELAESTDGGMRWLKHRVPDRDRDPADAPTRGCSPVGCVWRGWVRIGWGQPGQDEDLEDAPAPVASMKFAKSATAMGLRCEAVGSVAAPSEPPPSRAQPSSSTAPVVPHPVIGILGPVAAPAVPLQTTNWLPFRGVAPPALGKDEIGLSNHTPNQFVSLRAYAWGRRGADWTRAGHFLVRFDDRFDAQGGTRSSVISASPWADEASAAEVLGVPVTGLPTASSMSAWSAFVDPSGRAALVFDCRSSQTCAVFAVADGQPAQPLREAAGRPFTAPLQSTGAVRIGDAWFFLSSRTNGRESLTLERALLGTSREIATLPRVTSQRGASAENPRLVRRAHGGGLGLLVSAATDAGDRADIWYVLPVDPETGAIGDAVRLGRKDFGGHLPERCAPQQDGWAFDVVLDPPPSVDLTRGQVGFESVALRVRVDPGAACVESAAAVLDGPLPKDAAPASTVRGSPEPANGQVVLTATERTPSGRRWAMRCSDRRR